MMPAANEEPSAERPRRNGKRRRARSARYPGAGLGESLELCRFLAEHGLDGLGAADIALALGYRNVKTNTFSARLSAARQFGLLALRDEGYALTPRALAILAEKNPAKRAGLLREAFHQPSLYAELAGRLAGKRVPEESILANVLEHQHAITASAKRAAADAFLASARFAGLLGDDQILREQGTPEQPARVDDAPVQAQHGAQAACDPGPLSADVRFSLRLWDADEGKRIRVRAPATMSAESFERLLQALRLHVKVVDANGPGRRGDA